MAVISNLHHYQPQPATVSSASIVSTGVAPSSSAPSPVPVAVAPATTNNSDAPLSTNDNYPHAIPSILPAHMNIVPEDGYLNNVTVQGGDEFLFDLTEEDWAIGEGFEMDVS